MPPQPSRTRVWQPDAPRGMTPTLPFVEIEQVATDRHVRLPTEEQLAATEIHHFSHREDISRAETEIIIACVGEVYVREEAAPAPAEVAPPLPLPSLLAEPVEEPPDETSTADALVPEEEEPFSLQVAGIPLSAGRLVVVAVVLVLGSLLGAVGVLIWAR